MYVLPSVTTTSGRSSSGGQGESHSPPMASGLVQPTWTTFAGGSGQSSNSRGIATSAPAARRTRATVTELAPEEDPLHDRPLVLEAAAEREVPLELGREGAVDAAGGRDLRGVAGGSEDARAMAVLGEQPPEPDRDLRAAAGLPGDDQG